MTTEERENNFVENAKHVLDQDAENLDGTTTSRLRQMRYAALEKAESNWWQRFRLPAAALVTASLIATFTFVQMRTSDELQTVKTIEDMEILASSEQLDLYEDYDFYTWLAEEQKHAG
jgi:hypothetical protein